MFSSQFSADSSWVGSRFNIRNTDIDGTLLLFNSYAGSFARIPLNEITIVERALDGRWTGFPHGILADLVLNGFLVPAGVDELAAADELHAAQFDATSVLHLILLPNENCNFRCKYCSQTFSRSRMRRDVIEGVAKYVDACAHRLSVFSVGWFGGEPLLACDLIEELSARFQESCNRHNVSYSGTVTTNGYLLRPAVASMLFRAAVRRFQITLDGVPEDHDRLRVLADGHSATSTTILENLTFLHETKEEFSIVIRVNFDDVSVQRMEPFLDNLESLFSGDSRFVLDFHPVGKWGGPNDHALPACGMRDGRFLALDLADRAAKRGFDLLHLRSQLKPYGTRCYAADPQSFVVGSDGAIYKCTVALDDPRNKIGYVTVDGQFILDDAKHNRWIASGEESDSGCRACSFRPSCQGNACPLHRMDSGESPCPSVKVNIGQAMRIVSADLVRTITGSNGRRVEV